MTAVVKDVMTTKLIWVEVSPDDTVEHAARLMCLRRVKRLPVAGARGHLADRRPASKGTTS